MIFLSHTSRIPSSRSTKRDARTLAKLGVDFRARGVRDLLRRWGRGVWTPGGEVDWDMSEDVLIIGWVKLLNY